MSVPVFLNAAAQLGDTAYGFVSEDDRKFDGELASPKVNIGAADACHLGANEHRAGFYFSGQRILDATEGRFESVEDRGAACGGEGISDHGVGFSVSLT